MAQPLERCDRNTKCNRVSTGQENISVVIHPCLCRNAVDYRLLKFQYHRLGNTAPQPRDPKNGLSTKLLQRKRHERLQDQPCLAFFCNDSGCADTNYTKTHILKPWVSCMQRNNCTKRNDDVL